MHSWRRYHLGHNTRDGMRLMLKKQVSYCFLPGDVISVTLGFSCGFTFLGGNIA